VCPPSSKRKKPPCQPQDVQVPASRSNTCLDECSPVTRSFSGSSLRAASSATERHSQEGTVASSTFLRRDGTPALRKYFCASTSEATCDHEAGTSTSSA